MVVYARLWHYFGNCHYSVIPKTILISPFPEYMQPQKWDGDFFTSHQIPMFF
jgi:hypothetical protein